MPILTTLIPLPMASGIGFLIPASCSLEMCIGGTLALYWETFSPELGKMKNFIAAGFIAGGGVTGLTQVVIALSGGAPPMTVSFGAS